MSKAETFAMTFAEGDMSPDRLTALFQQAINYGKDQERRAAQRRLDRLYVETDHLDSGDWSSVQVYQALVRDVINPPKGGKK